MSGREVVLARIRTALADATPAPVVPRDYRLAGSAGAEEVRDRLAARVRDYGATVVVTADPAAAVASALRDQGAERIVVAPDLEPALRPLGFELVEDGGLSHRLDELDASVTTAACACADTGTLALAAGPGQGRRAISLVPDLHVCLVRVEDIVETVPELVDALAESALEGRPIVLVSGPSATSDIELSRVEGVHGPRRLVVVVVEPKPGVEPASEVP